jgi:AraC-like DNA-binding protein
MKTNYLPVVTSSDLARIKPPYVHLRRKANEYILYFILSGEMHLMEDKTRYNLKANDFIILDPSKEHYGLNSTSCEFIYIHFFHECMENSLIEDRYLKDDLLNIRLSSLKHSDKFVNCPQMQDRDLILPKYHEFKNFSRILTMLDFLTESIKTQNSRLEHHDLNIGCKLMELLITISREYTSELLYHNTSSTSRSSRTVHDMLAYFNSSYYTTITSDSLEERFQCNFDHINRVFRNITGKTIFVYLAELRIEKAKQLLKHQIFSISDVAEKTGFSDGYYFSKVFKKHTGVSPSVYVKTQVYTSGRVDLYRQ